MCGIAGIFNTDGSPVSVVTLRAMTDSMAHRGPDGEGFFTDSFIGLGHRRLAIIDLSPAGHQPMATPDGQSILTYNGEIYNFNELRVELEAKGYQFRSRTDSEVVLYAYREWGEDCVHHFNGMFAFAVWDKRRQLLFLARDRYGIKPLYYVQVGRTLLFASEIKAFLRHPQFRVEVSHSHLLEYFTFQNILSDGTLFKGVGLLPPAHCLVARLGSADLYRYRYWDFDFSDPDQIGDTAEYEAELDRLFQQAVQRQLMSDVPVGAYLSGGMDSGSITALAARNVPHLTTFTCGFDLTSASGLELAFDERAKAEALSYQFKTEHYEVILKAGDMERCLRSLVWHLEDPRVGQSYPNYYVARLASKFVRVILSGTGGDELFAGYPWRYYPGDGGADFDQYIQNYYHYWHRLIPNRYMPEFFTADVWREIKDIRTIDVFRSILDGHRHLPGSPAQYVNQSLYFEAKTFLHGLLLVDDKLGMAHSLESRVPFLDNDLVEFAQRVPMALKLKNLAAPQRVNENEPAATKYAYKTRDGKQLLRQVMRRYVPESVVDQVKQGFSGPDASWFRGESIEYVRSVIGRPNAMIYEYLQRDLVSNLLDDHLSGRQNRRLLLWSLLNFEEWCNVFVRGIPPGT